MIDECLRAAFSCVPGVVAIPVRDEVERIADCLVALARQEGGAPGVVLLVNNTTDATVAVVEELRPSLGMPLAVLERSLPPAQANAGHARLLAMETADVLAPEGVPLLCTDADGRAAPDWLAGSLAHLSRGVEAVYGRALIDPVEAARIPPALHAADAVECGYAALLDEIAHRMDPEPNDPWPRHTEHSGASIAVSRAAYHRAGGVPAVALGEDRAFAQALRRVDAAVRHAPEVQVVVSGRILGRAVGGMADTIRRRLVAPDPNLDDALEPVATAVVRLRLRRLARAGFAQARAGRPGALLQVAERAGLRHTAGLALLNKAYFGEVWEALDRALPRATVPVAQAARQTALARAMLARLRAAEPALV